MAVTQRKSATTGRETPEAAVKKDVENKEEPRTGQAVKVENKGMNAKLKPYEQAQPKGIILKAGEEDYPMIKKDNQAWPKDDVWRETTDVNSSRPSYVLVASKDVPQVIKD